MKRNSYQCTTCRGIVFTEDAAVGVTPFMMGCRASDGCTGTMESAFYNLPEQAALVRPHYVWRKPTREEYDKMNRPMKMHIDQGGLELYPLGPAPEVEKLERTIPS